MLNCDIFRIWHVNPRIRIGVPEMLHSYKRLASTMSVSLSRPMRFCCSRRIRSRKTGHSAGLRMPGSTHWEKRNEL